MWQLKLEAVALQKLYNWRSTAFLLLLLFYKPLYLTAFSQATAIASKLAS